MKLLAVQRCAKWLAQLGWGAKNIFFKKRGSFIVALLHGARVAPTESGAVGSERASAKKRAGILRAGFFNALRARANCASANQSRRPIPLQSCNKLFRHPYRAPRLPMFCRGFVFVP